MLEHRFAQLTAAATFLLLMIGGTVNPTGSSLACPEPTLVCNGEIFPAMVGGVLYEHGHRLAGMTVGLLQIVLTILLLRRRPSLRPWAIGLLVLVCAQGALGAITVYYKLPWFISLAHLCTAMLYFAGLLYVAWRTHPGPASGAATGLPSVRRWAAIASVAVLLQIAIGGLVRHLHGFLACLDLPLCHGRVLAPLSAPTPLQIHLVHRTVGVLVGALVIAAAVMVVRSARGRRSLQALAVFAAVLVVVQIGLGALTIMTVRSVPVAVAHFGGAVLLWGTWVAIWLGARPRTSAVDQPSVRDPDSLMREVER